MKQWMLWAALGACFVIVIPILMSIHTVQAGHVGVVSTFGKVEITPLEEGFHFVAPWKKVTLYDARQKSHKESVGVPSQDQLITHFDISIQYRLIKSKAPEMMKETGKPQDVFEIHMIPLLRSKVREIGKKIKTAEEFYLQATQQLIQSELLSEMTKLSKHGLQIDALLIRDIRLPAVITSAVERKKQMSQEAEKAKEELKKFEIDQEKKEKQALAEKKAQIIDAEKKAEVAKTIAQGDLEAEKIRAQAVIVKAEAEKKAMELLIDAVGKENFLKLEAIKILPQFQNGNHVIFMDPNKSSPLPFLNVSPKTK